MPQSEIRAQWESAAPGWARWEGTVATWMEPATDAMLAMAGVPVGARVLDLASGAGSQTLRAARQVGPHGHVVATDIADTMLQHVRENARAAGLANVTTIIPVPLRMPSAAQALAMMQEAFGAYRAVVRDQPAAVQEAAWTEVATALLRFETPTGFVAPAEVLIAAAEG